MRVCDPGATERLPGDGIHGVIGDAALAGAWLLAAVVTVAHVVRRIRESKLWPLVAEQHVHVLAPGGIATEDAVVATEPEVARLGSGLAGGFLERGLLVEVLHLTALLAGFQLLEELGDLIVGEAGDRQVHVGHGVQVGEQAG